MMLSYAATLAALQVTTEGDAFIVAFHEPLDAIGWALHVQLALLEAPWPQELLSHPVARLDTCPEGKLLFRGLRVRMAINTGIPAEIIVRGHALRIRMVMKTRNSADVIVSCHTLEDQSGYQHQHPC